MKKLNIALFGYDFEHRKTRDFFNVLSRCDGIFLTVFAAPWKKISEESKKPDASKLEQECEDLGFAYFRTEHSDAVKIKKILTKFDIKLGIIAGARIIPKSVITLFDDGIINFHPGKIPETSGLDALHYSIVKNIPLGVTSHYIDHKVDAGKLISFSEISFELSDGLDAVKEKVYQLQIKELLKVANVLLQEGAIKSSDIDRPFKNMPLTLSEKENIEEKFEFWKSYYYIAQKKRSVFQACTNGVLSVLKEIDYPKMIVDMKSDEGWSPLGVAAYNQHSDICDWLINHGADVNYQTQKGTSVLMYAKTKANLDNLATLDVLLSNGANDALVDMHNKNVHDYLLAQANKALSEYIAKHSKARG